MIRGIEMSNNSYQKLRRYLAAFALTAFGAAAARGENLDVVVSIAPVHSLAAGVMEGVGEPHLLLQGGASAHTYAMKPSDAKRLQNADIIIQVSDGYEVFLQKSLKTLPKTARIITLDKISGITLLPVREGGEFEEHAHDGDHKHGHTHGKTGGHAHGHGDKHTKTAGSYGAKDEHAGHGEHDVHLWFDPGNAQVIVRHLAGIFSQAAPQHAEIFKGNAARMIEKLEVLDAEVRRMSENSKGKPFIVFHDIVQYFEKRYGLSSAGAVTLSPERQPGAKRLAAVRKKISRLGAVCVFAEPQFSPKLIETIIEGTQSKRGILDEIGVGLTPGPDLYFQFIRKNAESLNSCLQS